MSSVRETISVGAQKGRRWSMPTEASIDHNDLTALLYAQGYRKSEFVP